MQAQAYHERDRITHEQLRVRLAGDGGCPLVVAARGWGVLSVEVRCEDVSELDARRVAPEVRGRGHVGSPCRFWT